jgi:hypothetical protein
VYIERVFDRKATFVGLEAVKEYWIRQIVGKQSNISFRHLTSRMIRDIDQPIAVVQWLAELDNKREQRGPDKTYKRVQFAQMARLTFAAVNDNDNHPFKICELEEYAQPMTGPGVLWPGLERPERDYAACLRMERVPDRTPPNTAVVECHYCRQGFKSRSQLFKHLNTTTPSEHAGHACQSTEPQVWIWISMSVGYSTNANLVQRIKQLIQETNQWKCTDESIDWNSCTWAVPPEWSTCAVVNVCSIKMLETTWQRLGNNVTTSSKSPTDITLLPPPPPLVSLDQSLRIHTMVPVDRPCVSERREFEKYEAFVPWRFLQSPISSRQDDIVQGNGLETDDVGGVKLEHLDDNDLRTATYKGWRRQDYHQSVHRKPLEETPAGEFCNVAMTRRLRTCTRILKDGGKTDVGDFFDAPGQLKIRLRCSTLDVPYQAYCRISMSMRQPYEGCVEAIMGILVKFATINEMTEEDLREEAVAVTNQLRRRRPTVNNDMVLLPSDFCVLLEPGLNRYEVKAGVQLSGGYTNDTTPDSSFWAARQSMDAMEHSILREMTSKLPKLQKWVSENILTTQANQCYGKD